MSSHLVLTAVPTVQQDIKASLRLREPVFTSKQSAFRSNLAISCARKSPMSDGVRAAINATTMFSFWPEVLSSSPEYPILKDRGCLINPDLGGLAFDATKKSCRDLVWNQFLKPRYYDQGVTSYWLDETDGEGTVSARPSRISSVPPC